MFIPREALIGKKEEQHKVEGHLMPRHVCTTCLPEVIHSSQRGRPRLSEETRKDRIAIGILLKKFRREKFKTQIECAHAVGLHSAAAIANLERGTWFNEKVIAKVLDYLKQF